MGKQKLHRQRKPHSTRHGAPALSIAPACLVPSLARKITPLFPLGLSEGTVLCVLRITGPSPLGGCFLTWPWFLLSLIHPVILIWTTHWSGELQPTEEPRENMQKQTATNVNAWLMQVEYVLRMDFIYLFFLGNTLPQQLFLSVISA